MQSFAIIPAAGRSQRMGQPKLLLPWGGSTVIEHVLGVWRSSQVTQVVMVVHPQDQQLAEVGRGCGAMVVQPQVAPSEMKISVRIALDVVAEKFQPQPHDAWLLSPPDMPGITADVIDRLIAAYSASLDRSSEPAIWAASRGGKLGHPTLFPWSLAVEVARLANDEGIDSLVARHQVEMVDAPLADFADLDTPADYDRLRGLDSL